MLKQRNVSNKNIHVFSTLPTSQKVSTIKK